MDQLRIVLSVLITSGLQGDVDSMCKERLGIGESGASVGLAMAESISFFSPKTSSEVWCISGNVTATRLLGIVLVLKVIALFEGANVFFVLPTWLITSVTEHTEVANSVINFYTTSLSKYVGEAYQPPSLSYLANLWFQGSSELIRIILISYISLTGPSDELRQAIRIVFDASIFSMSDEEAISTLEHWQHYGTCFYLDYLL